MQVNPKTVKKQFEKNMDKYDSNAFVQIELAQKLITALSACRSDFDSILEQGCGTGILSRLIKEKICYRKYFANDIVEKSKNYLDKILPEYTFICGNAQKIKPPVKVDLIISNAMFQWFTSLENSLEHFKGILEKNGLLAFTTFTPENFCEIRRITGLSLDYKSKADITAALEKDYQILHIEEYRKVLNFNNPLELLAHMKNTGVNSLAAKGLTFKEVKDFCDKYLELYPDVRLTYAPIIVIARLK